MGKNCVGGVEGVGPWNSVQSAMRSSNKSERHQHRPGWPSLFNHLGPGVQEGNRLLPVCQRGSNGQGTCNEGSR